MVDVGDEKDREATDLARQKQYSRAKVSQRYRENEPVLGIHRGLLFKSIVGSLFLVTQSDS